VTTQWQRFAVVALSIAWATLGLTAIAKIIMILTSGTLVESHIGASFGQLPDICLKSVPGNSASVTFAFYELHMTGGMELFNNRSSVAVAATSQQVCFNTSALRQPRFADVTSKYPNKVPQPKISIAVLYRAEAHAAHMKGLYLKIMNYRLGKDEAIGSFVSNDKSLREGYFDTHLLTASKHRTVHCMTEFPVTWSGMLAGFTSTEDAFQLRRAGTNYQVNVNCSRMVGPSGQTWATNQPDSFIFEAFSKSAISGGPCSDDWKMVHLMVKFPEDTVLEKDYVGIPLQIFRLVCGLGGLYSLILGLLTYCFIPAHREHPVVKIYDKRTFRWAHFFESEEPASEDGLAKEGENVEGYVPPCLPSV